MAFEISLGLGGRTNIENRDQDHLENQRVNFLAFNPMDGHSVAKGYGWKHGTSVVLASTTTHLPTKFRTAVGGVSIRCTWGGEGGSEGGEEEEEEEED